jgi:tripartite-type tricarboxylate transporter receptor subunit TctC
VLRAVRDDPDWVTQVKRRGSIPSVLTPEETRRFVEAQYKSYRSLSSQLSVK